MLTQHILFHQFYVTIPDGT